MYKVQMVAKLIGYCYIDFQKQHLSVPFYFQILSFWEFPGPALITIPVYHARTRLSRLLLKIVDYLKSARTDLQKIVAPLPGS